MRSRLLASLIFTLMTTLTTFVCYTVFLGADALWQLLLAYAASTFVGTLVFWYPVSRRPQTSRFGGAWIGIMITATTLIGFTVIRFTFRGDAAALLDWQTVLASLAYTFGYVGWVLTILNIVLGFLLAGTRPKVRYEARAMR
ncbi:hypothetical protein ACFQO8_02940 [Exiguobacterium aestuarii]|uniref:Uncharacterized protein n=1 Tax=Exiguobacterium aestuarii TaxID=273527 RepID=A0ABW2PN54_9BACL|nr:MULTISPECIES: hypothetical protein [Exiguobacterium]MCT4785928.1 hypothetical protein [Exiguobacterium aestuarii]